MRTRLTFHELEKFIDVSETLSFRASAVRCCISQPALSRTIASAEAKLGTRLFDRNTRGVTLTSSGKQLLPIARRIFFELNDSLSDLSEFVAGHRGQIAIASIPSVAAALLPLPIQTYLNAHPGVSIDLKAVSASDVVSAVAAGDADIGISAFASVGSAAIADGHEFTPVVQDELILMCAKDDPLAGQETVSWDVFATRPYIANGPASSLRSLVQRTIAEAGVTAAPRYESTNLAVTARMVAAGLGIAVLSSLSRSMINADGLALVALNGPRLSRDIGVITRRGRSLSQPAQDFLRHFLRDHGRVADAGGDTVPLSR